MYTKFQNDNEETRTLMLTTLATYKVAIVELIPSLHCYNKSGTQSIGVHSLKCYT